MKKEIGDSLQVMTANGSAIGLNLTSCNEILTFISLVLAIAFTIYKFTKDAQKEKINKGASHPKWGKVEDAKEIKERRFIANVKGAKISAIFLK